MKEQNYTICGTCEEIKMRIHDGNYNKKDKRYVDEKGLSWNGIKWCGDCNILRMRERMQIKRNKGKVSCE